jgi:hypothetical protein
MAIEARYFSLVAQVLQRLADTPRPLNGLFLSYPDLLLSRSDLLNFFKAEDLARVPIRPDSADIWRWHGLAGNPEPIYDSVALFSGLGVKPTIIDVVAARGVEEIVDLNFPLEERFVAKFDLVVDTGTCEHCFNVGQAFANACSAVKQGGYLIHAAPLSRANHGFWNFCPTVYPDFFGDNGFVLNFMSGMTVDMRNGFKPFPVTAGRFQAPSEAILFVVAQRTAVLPLTWPVQGKYRTSK